MNRSEPEGFPNMPNPEGVRQEKNPKNSDKFFCSSRF